MTQIWHTPHVSDIEKQIKWEITGVERGVARVREAMADQKVSDGAVGVAILRRLAPTLIRNIEEAQEEAARAMNSGKRGRPELWWPLILTLPAEQLAVITIKSVLNSKPRDFAFALPITGVAGNINKAVFLQFDYESWKAEQEEKEREENLHLHFLRSTKQVNAQRFQRFCEKIGRKKSERWSHAVGVAFGIKLLQLLVEAAPNWFSVKMGKLRGGRTELRLIFSDEAKDTLADLMERCELSKPMLMPMICPPAAWRKCQ